MREKEHRAGKTEVMPYWAGHCVLCFGDTAGCSGSAPTWPHVDRQYGESCFGKVGEGEEGAGGYLPLI